MEVTGNFGNSPNSGLRLVTAIEAIRGSAASASAAPRMNEPSWPR